MIQGFNVENFLMETFWALKKSFTSTSLFRTELQFSYI